MAEYKRQRYLFMTLDPVHIGAGGYHLGRVDLSIVREPGTRVPKIPGASLHGAARSYAAQLYENPEAAGQSQENVADPDRDPVCYTFGYIKKSKQEETKAYSGVVSIFDAHVLLFPVYSMAGPVWVSTKARLEEAGFTVSGVPNQWEQGRAILSWDRKDPLNLGWLMLEVEGRADVDLPDQWAGDKFWDDVRNRIVLVADSLFSHVVNSNLEVRTSVSIDPKTGAAEEGKLFTYEAIPRSTFLTADIVLDDYRTGTKDRPFPVEKTAQANPLPGGKWEGPLDVVNAGLRMIEWLGVGGMGTRGFGRITIIGNPLEWEYGKEDQL